MLEALKVVQVQEECAIYNDSAQAVLVLNTYIWLKVF